VPGMVVVDVVVRIGGSGSVDALSVVPQAPATSASTTGRLAKAAPARRGRGRVRRSVPVMSDMIGALTTSFPAGPTSARHTDPSRPRHRHSPGILCSTPQDVPSATWAPLPTGPL